MDGDVFAEGIAVTDFHPCGSPLPFQVLGAGANAGKRIDLVFLTQGGVAVQHHVGMKVVLRSEPDLGSDHAIRSDDAILADFCAGMDDGAGVYVGAHIQRSTSMKVTQASLTVSPLTEQTPFALAILARVLVISTSIIKVSPGRTGLRHLTSSADMK